MPFATTKTILALLAIPLLAQAQDACSNGNYFNGYCCDGSIAKVNADGGSDPSNLICCVGDDSSNINLGSNAPTSCTSGSAVPLTQQPMQTGGDIIGGGITGDGGNGETIAVSGGSTTLLATGGSTIIGGVGTSATATDSSATATSAGAGGASATAASGSASSSAGAAMITGGVMQAAMGLGAIAAMAL